MESTVVQQYHPAAGVPSTLQLLRLAARLAEDRNNAGLVRFGLTRASRAILDAAATGPAGSITLANRLGLRRQSLDRILPRLEARGYISRTWVTARRYRIEITSLGSEVLDVVPPEPALLGADEERALRQGLFDLLAGLPPEKERYGPPTSLAAVPDVEESASSGTLGGAPSTASSGIPESGTRSS